MKVKSYKIFESSHSLLTQKQFNWCNRCINGKWKINLHGEIETEKDVFIRGDFDRFPVKFAPVKGNFDCDYCTSLISLDGAPSSVGGSFSCTDCTSLTSLTGVSSLVDSDFYCDSCTSLTSLEGAPSSVSGDFCCRKCTNLTSLKGAPSSVGGGFYCGGCTSLPLEQVELASNRDLFKRWLRSGISAKEFLHKNRGSITGKKFGI